MSSLALVKPISHDPYYPKLVYQQQCMPKSSTAVRVTLNFGECVACETWKMYFWEGISTVHIALILQCYSLERSILYSSLVSTGF